MDANKPHREKAKWELYKIAVYSFQQISRSNTPTKLQLDGNLPAILLTIQVNEQDLQGSEREVSSKS